MRRMWLSVQTQKQATYSTLWVLRDVAYQSVYKRGQVLTKHLSCDALESILLPESLNGLSTTGYPVTVTQSPRGTTWNPVSFVTSITNSNLRWRAFLSFFLSKNHSRMVSDLKDHLKIVTATLNLASLGLIWTRWPYPKNYVVLGSFLRGGPNLTSTKVFRHGFEQSCSAMATFKLGKATRWGCIIKQNWLQEPIKCTWQSAFGCHAVRFCPRTSSRRRMGVTLNSPTKGRVEVVQLNCCDTTINWKYPFLIGSERGFESDSCKWIYTSFKN